MPTRRPASRTPPPPTAPLAECIAQVAPLLTAAERRVAEVLLAGGPAVAFGTVAGVAQSAGAGAATVVRTAMKLGFEGFTELQAQVRREFSGEPESVDRTSYVMGDDELIAAMLELELGNLRRSVEMLDGGRLEALVDDLADLRPRVAIVAGDAATGVAASFARELGALRPGVTHLVGNQVGVTGALAQYDRGDLVIVVGLRPYDRWLLEVVAQADHQGLRRTVITDSVLSSLAGGAAHCLVVCAEGEGPFPSQVGVLAMTNIVVAATARRLRKVATDRLERVEAAWQRHGALRSE